MPMLDCAPGRRALRILAVAAALFLAAVAWFPSGAFAARRVVIVSIDGLRPDVALRADMPALRSLMARGSFTMYAATTDVAVTLPSHVSMLTGVTPAKHGITYNSDPNPGDLNEPRWPTLFEVAHRAGLTTAMAAGKGKFSVLAGPGTLDTSFVPPRGGMASDSIVAEVAARWIAAQRPQVLFVHLPGLDRVGHASGWGSPAQVAAAATADRALGQVLGALARAGLFDSTLIIVSADHGGAGTTHGGLDPRSHFIPWIAAGPGVRHDFDLTRMPALQVRTEDTFATAAAWLGLRIVKPVDGHGVEEIFEGHLQPR
jgi:predicted AlkP superfamily pyrophosphatase or phosphodiesterase